MIIKRKPEHVNNGDYPSNDSYQEGLVDGWNECSEAIDKEFIQLLKDAHRVAEDFGSVDPSGAEKNFAANVAQRLFILLAGVKS